MTKAKSRFSFIADRAMHIGQQIKLILEERGISAIEFAAMIHCNRSNVYDIFQRKSIDTQRLKIISKALPFAEDSNGIVKVLFGHGFYVYFAVLIALIVTFIFNRTKIGLNLRAIGENTATADAMGVNITLYKYVAILLGGGIAGFGGVFYIMDYVKGSWENASTIEAFGWLAIALVIFTLWKPNISIIGSYLFGALYIAAFVFGNISFSGKEILKMLPYVITIIVLIVTSMMNKKENQPPQNLGLNYFREER